jgi:hypothetical protein
MDNTTAVASNAKRQQFFDDMSPSYSDFSAKVLNWPKKTQSADCTDYADFEIEDLAKPFEWNL